MIVVSAAVGLVGACGTTSSHDHAPAQRSAGAVWSTSVRGWPFALTADTRDAVVIAGRGEVVDLDPRTGRERWRAAVSGASFYEPALGPRTVLLSAGDRFVSLDRASGTRRWEVPADGQAGAVTQARVGGSDLALVTTETGWVAALDSETGAVRWSLRQPGPVYAAPVVSPAAGLVAVGWSGAEPRLRAIDAASGAVRWEAGMGRSSSAPVVGDGLVVTGEGDGSYRARVVARDLSTGAERWSAAVSASFEPSVTPGARAHEVVVVDHFGAVTLVDLGRHRVRWRRALDRPVLRTSVLITGAAVLLNTHDGEIVVLDRRSGRIVRRADPGGYPAGIALAGGRLLVALRLSEPGRVEARRLP